MKDLQRHHWLDQFYSLREKYRLEREGKEACANEELAFFSCNRERTALSGLFKSGATLEDRMDPCGVLRRLHEKCVWRMTVSATRSLLFLIS